MPAWGFATYRVLIVSFCTCMAGERTRVFEHSLGPMHSGCTKKTLLRKYTHSQAELMSRSEVDVCARCPGKLEDFQERVHLGSRARPWACVEDALVAEGGLCTSLSRGLL